jgi:hypothetical protein
LWGAVVPGAQPSPHPESQAALQRAPRGVAFSVTREELLKHNTTDCQFGLRLQWACKHCRLP